MKLAPISRNSDVVAFLLLGRTTHRRLSSNGSSRDPLYKFPQAGKIWVKKGTIFFPRQPDVFVSSLKEEKLITRTLANSCVP